MAKVTHKEIRRELEEDAVVETFRDWWNYYRAHQTAILATVAVVAVVFVTYQVVRRQRLSVLEQANFSLVQARRERQLARQTADAQQRATLYDSSETKLETLIGRFAGKPIGQRALYLSGASNLDQMKYAKARERFERYRQGSSTDVDRARGALAIGACWENEAFERDDDTLLDKALAAYDEAIALGGTNYVAYEAMIGKARILELKPETRPQAIELLERVIKERQPLIDQASSPAKKDKPGAEKSAAEPDQGPKPPEPYNLVEIAKKRLEKVKAMPAL